MKKRAHIKRTFKRELYCTIKTRTQVIFMKLSPLLISVNHYSLCTHANMTVYYLYTMQWYTIFIRTQIVMNYVIHGYEFIILLLLFQAYKRYAHSVMTANWDIT